MGAVAHRVSHHLTYHALAWRVQGHQRHGSVLISVTKSMFHFILVFKKKKITIKRVRFMVRMAREPEPDHFGPNRRSGPRFTKICELDRWSGSRFSKK
jgi:hypothetical protein